MSAQARHARWEVANVVGEADALIGALQACVHLSVGLHRRIIEIEAADVEHGLAGVAGIIGLEAVEIAAEVDVSIVKADRPPPLNVADRLEAPSARQRVGESGRIGAPAAAAAVRNLENAA